VVKRSKSGRLLWVRVVELKDGSRREPYGLVLYSPAGGWCLARGTRAQMQALQDRLLQAGAEENGDFAAEVEQLAQVVADFLRAGGRRW
jgi:hypothetical protein